MLFHGAELGIGKNKRNEQETPFFFLITFFGFLARHQRRDCWRDLATTNDQAFPPGARSGSIN